MFTHCLCEFTMTRAGAWRAGSQTTETLAKQGVNGTAVIGSHKVSVAFEIALGPQSWLSGVANWIKMCGPTRYGTHGK